HRSALSAIATDYASTKVCNGVREAFCFSNAPSSAGIYTLSLHDALPIWGRIAVALRALEARRLKSNLPVVTALPAAGHGRVRNRDRKSTRLNSSHAKTSYAVLCL